MTTIAIGEASIQDLRAFAEARGLDLPVPANANQVRSKILAAFPETIEIPVAGSQEQTTEQATTATAQAATAQAVEAEPAAPADATPTVPRCKIRLQAVKDGPKNVNVSVNGKTYLMNVGVDIDVPYYVELALRNAEETRFELHQENPRDKPDMVAVTSFAFPYTVLESANKAEIAAWEAWSNDKFAPE